MIGRSTDCRRYDGRGRLGIACDTLDHDSGKARLGDLQPGPLGNCGRLTVVGNIGAERGVFRGKFTLPNCILNRLGDAFGERRRLSRGLVCHADDDA